VHDNNTSLTLERSGWRIVPNATLHWQTWDDDCIVFNSASGQTHLLDPLPALLLRQVDEGCSDRELLLNGTAKLLDVELTAEIRGLLDQALKQLDDAGLIEPTT
jgi:PqqD family protein of HPr-rel-A system